MKKINCNKAILFLVLNLFVIFSMQSQTCDNCGIGTNTPTSKLHIKGCGNTSATSSLHVMNSDNAPLLFISDNKKVGIGHTQPVCNLHIDEGGYASVYLGSNLVTGHHITHEPSDNSLVLWSGIFGAGTQRWKLDSEGTITVGGGFTKVVTGNAFTQNFNWASGYIGFNTIRSTASSTWATAGDGYNNGGSVISGDVFGNIRFSTITTNGPANQTGLADTSVYKRTHLFVASWGKVGIGTTNPNYKLEVAGDIFANAGGIYTAASSNEGGSLIVKNPSKTVAGTNSSYVWWNMKSGAPYYYGDKFSVWGYPPAGNGAERFSIWDNGDFTFHSNSAAENVRITNAGNIGVGTTAPSVNSRLAIKDGHLQSQQTTGITSIAVNGSGTGTVTNATDVAGKISITPTASSTTATISFSKTYSNANPIVVITPTNAAAAAEMVSAKIYVTTTASTFVINFGAAPFAIEKTFNYFVIDTQ